MKGLLMTTLAATAAATAGTAKDEGAAPAYLYPPAPVVQLASQPPPRIYVDPPIASALALGRVVIQYHADNLRIVAVYGEGALQVSPRIGHIHVTVDDTSWHWADGSGEPLIINGLPPGPHSVLIELADPTHKIIDRQKVSFVIPQKAR